MSTIVSNMAFGNTTNAPIKKARDEALTHGVIFSVCLHVAAVAAIFLLAPTPVVAPMAPIMVSMITAPVPEPIRPEPQEIPKPRPVTPKPVPTPKTLLVAEKPAAEPAQAAPAPPPPPAPAVQAEEAPVVAVIPPRFDAAYLDNPAPPYPPMSRRMGEQGKVMLHVFVNPDGSAGKVELRTSSGASRLDQSALDTVKRWRFTPAKLGAQTVAAWVLVPISFTLGG
jgi:protein TonB